jgi:hypothetical protein
MSWCRRGSEGARGEVRRQERGHCVQATRRSMLAVEIHISLTSIYTTRLMYLVEHAGQPQASQGWQGRASRCAANLYIASITTPRQSHQSLLQDGPSCFPNRCVHCPCRCCPITIAMTRCCAQGHTSTSSNKTHSLTRTHNMSRSFIPTHITPSSSPQRPPSAEYCPSCTPKPRSPRWPSRHVSKPHGPHEPSYRSAWRAPPPSGSRCGPSTRRVPPTRSIHCWRYWAWVGAVDA